MARSYGGTTCPRCRQYARLIKGGTSLGEHKTEYYVMGQIRGGRRRERCPYSGGTLADAQASIPPLRRKTNDRLRAKEARGEALTIHEIAWLADKGIPVPGACAAELHGADGGPCPACGHDSHPIPGAPAGASLPDFPAAPVGSLPSPESTR